MTRLPIETALRRRCGGACELCGAATDVVAYDVVPFPPGAEPAIAACDACRAQIDGTTPFDAGRWHGLRESVWSEVPAVQVQSWRLLKRMPNEAWARDLLEQVYLDEELTAWAQSGADDAADTAAEATALAAVDSNGAVLLDGDSVTLIKDLDVKGAGFTAKRGTLVKNIRLTGDPAYVDARVNGVAIVLKTMFLKKVT